MGFGVGLRCLVRFRLFWNWEVSAGTHRTAVTMNQDNKQDGKKHNKQDNEKDNKKDDETMRSMDEIEGKGGGQECHIEQWMKRPGEGGKEQ